MKVCGSVGVVCALVCVLVTVTTTVVHMSRLQGLRECVYTARARYDFSKLLNTQNKSGNKVNRSESIKQFGISLKPNPSDS